jgi:flagellar export protein FliJ
MPFHFTLENILRLRRAQERQQELEVEAAAKNIASTIGQLHKLGEENSQLSASLRNPDISGAEIAFIRMQCRVLEQRRTQTEQTLQKLREQQAVLIGELRRMWQQREVLETLRNREFTAYELEQSRRNQAEQDELFLLRSCYAGAFSRAGKRDKSCPAR